MAEDKDLAILIEKFKAGIEKAKSRIDPYEDEIKKMVDDLHEVYVGSPVIRNETFEELFSSVVRLKPKLDFAVTTLDKIRNFRAKIEGFFTEVEFFYESQKDRLLTEDQKVRGEKSSELRNAHVEHRLQDLKKIYIDALNLLSLAKTLEKRAETNFGYLIRLFEMISRQITVVENILILQGVRVSKPNLGDITIKRDLSYE